MSDETGLSDSLEKPSDLGQDSVALARRWKIELKLADKREEEWRNKVKEVYKVYSPKNADRSSFNILYSNTETLRQATYNSLPEPQCRRRFDDENPLGLKVAEIMTRALEYSQDCGDFDHVCKQVVLGMLLAGRAVSWERYIPKISEGGYESTTDNENLYEEIEWEQVVSEKVRYEDFRILCAARTWDEVTAVARRHTLSRHDLVEKFGEEIGNEIKLDSVDLDDMKDSEEADLFKTADIWEIWDKETKKVIFICKSYPKPLKVEDDPLQLENFFPTPRPLYAIENDDTLEPMCLYAQYEPQARELNRVSLRITRLIDALRFRGVYDASLTELSQLMKSGDNDMIPSQNVTQLLERGGLEKAIWVLPIDMAAAVLKELYAQRDAIKSVIYELTGISDIMRSASDPRETFGAQKIKTQWGTQRLQRMQLEVQRYIRDMLHIKAEIICKKFQMETLEQMTQVAMPHQIEIDQQKQQMIMQYQQAAMNAQMQGQQPPPPPQMPPDPPTWEAAVELMQNDLLLSYQIDIETDSTISARQDDDMQGLRETLGGIVEIITGFAPAVQAGAISIDVVKALIGVAIRRAKMGTEVEQAINKMQQPPPQVSPEQIKAQAAQQQQQQQIQHEMQLKQMELESQGQLEQLKMENTMQIEQVKAQVQAAKEQAQAEGDAAKEQYRMQADMEIEQHKAQMAVAAEENKLRADYLVSEAERNNKVQLLQLEQEKELAISATQIEFDRWKAELEAATKISVAKISAKASLIQSAMTTGQKADEAALENEFGTGEPKEKKDEAANKVVELVGHLIEMHGQTMETMDKLTKQIAKPKRIIRDKDGKAQGVE